MKNHPHEYMLPVQRKYCDRQGVDCPSLAIGSKTPSHTTKRRRLLTTPVAALNESARGSKTLYPSTNMDGAQ